MDRYNGILPFKKEVGMTSHDVIDRLRRITAQKRIGHTGTLDPMASGLMLISLGRATKLTQFLSEWDKQYLAGITLGRVSDTLDGAGRITAAGEVPSLTTADVQTILDDFTGPITQQVPAYAAVKIDGRELYKYARSGTPVPSPVREVEITTLEVRSFVSPLLTIAVRCSKGTYIRALADDIGRRIGCGAYLSSLERTGVGPYQLSAALGLDEAASRQTAGRLDDAVLPIERVLAFPVVRIRKAVASGIINGVMPRAGDVVACDREFASGDLISLANEQAEILAIGRSTTDSAAVMAGTIETFFTYIRVLV